MIFKRLCVVVCVGGSENVLEMYTDRVGSVVARSSIRSCGIRCSSVQFYPVKETSPNQQNRLFRTRAVLTCLQAFLVPADIHESKNERDKHVGSTTSVSTMLKPPPSHSSHTACSSQANKKPVAGCTRRSCSSQKTCIRASP